MYLITQKEKKLQTYPIFNTALDNLEVGDYSNWLKNTLKLYVLQLGTTHHGIDDQSLLQLNLASEWQKNLKGTSFVSPVLHGTTGSSKKTFRTASSQCQKINIAGSLQKILLENLSSIQKKQLGLKSLMLKVSTFVLVYEP